MPFFSPTYEIRIYGDGNENPDFEGTFSSPFLKYQKVHLWTPSVYLYARAAR
jgi:hypothetical protein